MKPDLDVTLADPEHTGSEHAATARAPGGTTMNVGGYAVLGAIGSGGMGVVLAGYDADLDRKVAIKMLHQPSSGAGDESRRQRFLREAQALARISHPNVIPVYEVGVHDGQPFIAMEHIDGETLGEWATREPRSWRATREVYLQAARGLAACHEAGLVHRDVKPANILIDASGRVRVSDFGLARSTTELPTGLAETDDAGAMHGPLDATITNDGAVLGTPAYAAPEQLQGAPVDARADQFAFCVALYEALHGHRPGHARTAATRQVPPDLDEALRRGLDIDPGRRFDSMSELIDALGMIGAPRRTRGQLVAFAALVLAVVGVAGWLALRPAAPSRDASPGTQSPRPAKAARIAPAGGYSHPPKLRLLLDEGGEALMAGNVAEAERTFAAAHVLAQSASPLQLADVKTSYASALDAGGKREQAKKLVEAALAIYQRFPGREPGEVSDTHEFLGAYYFENDDSKSAHHHFAAALRIYEAAGLSVPDELANKSSNLAAALIELRRFDEAVPLLERALTLLTGAKFTEDRLEVYRKLAQLFRAKGDKVRADHYHALRKAAVRAESAP